MIKNKPLFVISALAFSAIMVLGAYRLHLEFEERRRIEQLDMQLEYLSNERMLDLELQAREYENYDLLSPQAIFELQSLSKTFLGYVNNRDLTSAEAIVDYFRDQLQDSVQVGLKTIFKPKQNLFERYIDLDISALNSSEGEEFVELQQSGQAILIQDGLSVANIEEMSDINTALAILYGSVAERLIREQENELEIERLRNENLRLEQQLADP